MGRNEPNLDDKEAEEDADEVVEAAVVVEEEEVAAAEAEDNVRKAVNHVERIITNGPADRIIVKSYEHSKLRVIEFTEIAIRAAL
mmetsp:Transcript_39808/g.82769  ORF Transcript_39808/g.82769 Transcript_39808/m.82769 type:complete len:85 (-) Transcript_39808:1692-1946(-)